MNVLFAVNNENISNVIIKRYPEYYKEVLSPKNVYYFNAILKEIQKNKNYDRIVISEDLEPFVNTNYDSIDNFIFEHLDKISDEAQDNEGKETAIILICSERRSPGSPILNKLFSIGVYNAVMGKDRNYSELCRLINKPRTKKEAKIYYRIDQANYDPVVENEVNETEIQNILTHFKKLGKNTERYADSFNNIAAQYTDEQLRIIINVLPIKVKAVLESESPKYQALMGSAKNDNKIQPVAREPGIKVNTIGGNNIQVSGPIVIPTGIVKPTPKIDTNISNISNNTMRVRNENKLDENSNIEKTEERRGRGRPKKVVIPTSEQDKPKGKRGRPPKNVTLKEENIEPEEINLEEKTNDIGLDDDFLPGIDGFQETNGTKEELKDNVTGLDDDSFKMDNEPETDELPGLDDENGISALLKGIEDDDDDFDIGSPSGIDDELLPGLEKSDDDELLPGLEKSDEDELLPGLEIPDEDSILPETDTDIDDNLLSNLNELDETSELPGVNDVPDNDENETIIPGMGFEDEGANEYVNESVAEEKEDSSLNYSPNYSYNNSNVVETVKPSVDYSMSKLNSLLSKDKKIVTFVGTTKNGTSFLVNNLALMFASQGIDTAILDMTKNRNSYYIFTNNREELREIAYTSIGKLENGYAEGIKVNKYFTVYTALPDDGDNHENAEAILSTLVQNHSLILIDCDFDTPPAYFASCQEIYLVQSMDILTIQPLTAFIRELKFKNAWEPEKARVVINKEVKVKCLNGKMIIAGMSRYNGPDMSVMTDLFNKDMIKACSIPFDEKVYCKYLEIMATCKLSLSGYSNPFIQKMKILSEMVYPSLNNRKTYGTMENDDMYNGTNNNFSGNMNDTLNQMRNRY